MSAIIIRDWFSGYRKILQYWTLPVKPFLIAILLFSLEQKGTACPSAQMPLPRSRRSGRHRGLLLGDRAAPARAGPASWERARVDADLSRRRGPAPAALPARQPGAAAHPTGRRAGGERRGRRPVGQWHRAWAAAGHLRAHAARPAGGRLARRPGKAAGRPRPASPTSLRRSGPRGEREQLWKPGQRARRGTGFPPRQAAAKKKSRRLQNRAGRCGRD